MKKYLIIIFSLLTLSGCYNAPDPVKPLSWLFKQMPEDAPNLYKIGWKDGCESGLSSMTSTAYKTFYSFKQDSKLRRNPVYYNTWKDTYTFCRHYVYGTIRQTNQRMNQPNQRSLFMTRFLGTQNIFEAGPLNLWGPGDALIPLNQVNGIGGNLGNSLGMQGAMDFTDDSVLNGKRGGMILDFTK